MRALLTCLTLITACPALAQSYRGPPAEPGAVTLPATPTDVAGLQAQVQAVQAQAATAVQPSTLTAAITASTPSPCTAPLPDTLTGTVGTGTPCMTRPDATRPTQVQSTRVTSAGDGTWVATWPVPFGATPTYGHAEALGGSQPLACDVLTLSTTGATGKCYALTSTTLPGTLLALSGLVVSPVSNPGAGLTVMIVGRQ